MTLSKKFLITGANFGNKGAQSMLFVVTDELRRRFPSCIIYFASSEKFPENDYTFRKVCVSRRALRAVAGGLDGVKEFCGGVVRDAVKFIIGRKNFMLADYYSLRKHLSDMSAVIDISGFALSSKWGNYIPYYYLAQITAAKRFNVPVYLMPQSFGPFDYTPDVMMKARPLIQNAMQYPRIIFAREKDGYDSLVNVFGLKQVRLSADLVLQNKGINPSNIFTAPPAISVPRVDNSTNTAGIVPNMRCFDHGDKDKILETYRRIIDYIIAKGYKVVLFRHSVEDIEACRTIKGFYPDNDNIILIENDFSCLEYNEFVKQFKFLVCSRYHGLVHAYKNNVPCVALGWAVKYRSLAENLGQSSYVFDITVEHPDTAGIIDSISRLLSNYDFERRTIREHLASIQEHNCFDVLEEYLRAND